LLQEIGERSSVARPKLIQWRTSSSENRFPLFRDMRERATV
jgi:hypothetical protein